MRKAAIHEPPNASELGSDLPLSSVSAWRQCKEIPALSRIRAWPRSESRVGSMGPAQFKRTRGGRGRSLSLSLRRTLSGICWRKYRFTRRKGALPTLRGGARSSGIDSDAQRSEWSTTWCARWMRWVTARCVRRLRSGVECGRIARRCPPRRWKDSGASSCRLPKSIFRGWGPRQPAREPPLGGLQRKA